MTRPARLPQLKVVCPNCGAWMLGTPCSVCAYVRQRPAIYPIGRDKLTDSYQKPATP